MESYRIQLLIGGSKWVTSEKMNGNFIVNRDAWETEPLAEVELMGLGGITAPIRKIEIDGTLLALPG